MSAITWTHTPPSWTASVHGETVCTLKGKDIGGWTASWSGERLWPAPAHLPKATPQATRFFMDLDEAKAAVEAALNS
ncbi:hypothetical protein RQP54_14745 [Curvibacter sp. APW13]|uniref:hypothetical protein n=1 Tax=Curvibacter sp. APW13 TaxID=3077236 RepID=UPI0028DDFF2D|nr:hypothetical protein [Curvibacter sp. APW13]MDT8992129.1 hypothetical protein [Curvibacter sp. APW13]